MQSSHKDQSSKTVRDNSGGGPMQIGGAATPPNVPAEMLPWEVACLASEDGHPDEIEGVDPFAQWSAAAPGSLASLPTPGKGGITLSPDRSEKARHAASKLGQICTDFEATWENQRET